MANTSNKNFPHAYGAGRCIAAFSLSHPGGPLEGEGESQVLPPAIDPFSGEGGDQYSPAVEGFPVQTDVMIPQGDPADPATLWTRKMDYRPDHQPLNATSFGVFVTGSGITSLPYRDAIAPYIPPQLQENCPAAAAALPESEGAIKRPFNVVEDVDLGSTRAQAVFTAEGGGEGTAPRATQYAWYEVALDWKIPDQTVTASTADLLAVPALGAAQRWASDAVASVRKGLARTMWVNASIATDSLSEPVPGATEAEILTDVPTSQIVPPDVASQVIASTVTSVPAPGNNTGPVYNSLSKGMQGPYSTTTLIDGSDPALGLSQFPLIPRFPYQGWNAGEALAAEALQVRASVDVLVTGVSYTYKNMTSDGIPTEASTLEGRISFAPVVRVWCLLVQDNGQAVVTAIPRIGCAPVEIGSELNFQDYGDSPGAINVQVMQKNSSAFDATDTPVYDLFDEWGTVNRGGV